MSSQEKNITKKVVHENHLDFLTNLYITGIELPEEDIALLKEKGFIKDDGDQKEKEDLDNINDSIQRIHSKENISADKNVDISFSIGLPDTEHDVLTEKELIERKEKYGHIFEGRDTEIEDSEWLPESNTEHTQGFIDWINSIIKHGVHEKIQYHKFSLYVQQAYMWLSENKTSTDFDDEEERLDYQLNEIRRCSRNVLYFLNKYAYYQEGNATDGSGRVKYQAAPAHEIVCYLDDAGYSVGLVKGRQQAMTTTIMSIDVRDVVCKQNHFMKFICEDEKKTVEIFEDKLKFPFSQLPNWLRPTPLNDRDNFFKIGSKEEKGKKTGVGSSIRVLPPKRTAVAGGAPQKVRIDEAGNINILSIMIGNARPTMMWYDPVKKKLVLKRKLWFYGTGGEMDKGGKDLETEFMAILKAWENGDYSSCIVPLFFNWTARPGATQEDYDREKKVAYAKASNPNDPKGKQHIVEFFQSWPTTLSDVFRTSARTLVDDDYIDAALNRIREAKKKHGFTLHQSGYFEPVYDQTKPMPENSIVPFKIIDSIFVPTGDIDPRATVTIFKHPEKGWINRYFKGTDPIDTNSGVSKFASTVWDKHWQTPTAILNWRVPDYQQVFLQSLLLNIYYDTKEHKTGIKELLESNRGTSYYDFIKNMGWDNEFVLNYQLPINLINRTTINEGVGIDNKGIRNTIIINQLFELINHFGDRNYFDIFWEQLKTFTCKISATGKEVWEPINKKHFNDDVLFSTVFSYICAVLCFPELNPANIENLKSENKVVMSLVRDPKTQKLERRAVRKTIISSR